jgi:hypothetical protein
LQSYIVKNIGTNANPSLDSSVLGGNTNFDWLGNEVSCGVGMQRIDIMLSVLGQQPKVIPVELKATVASHEIASQLERYIDWIEQYYIPNKPSDIEPIVIAKIQPHNTANYAKLTTELREINKKRNILPIKYIEFEVKDGGITFIPIDYKLPPSK